MPLFGRKKNDDSAAGDPGDSAAGNGFQRDDRKARKFFDHAEGAADKNNLAFAIEMYVGGLRFDADNMIRHEALLDVAKRHKAGGGKRAGSREKKALGPTAVDKMLLAEKVWAYDFLDQDLMIEFFRRAVKADGIEPEINLTEVADWIGTMALELPGPKPKLKNWIALRDLFEEIGIYDKAVIACKQALGLKPGDDTLLASLKDLEAQAYSSKNTSTEKGGFRQNVKDADYAAEAAAGKSGAASKVDAAIDKARDEYEDDPEDLDRLKKLVDALLRKESFESDEEALNLLELAHDTSGQYRYRVQIGDIRMKQFSRELRQLKEFVQAAPDDPDYTRRYKDKQKERIAFELGEYTDRVKNYPTDLRLKYELGRRLFQTHRFDDAIGYLQQASEDPKSKNEARMLLGLCFMEQQWYGEAVETLRGAADDYGIKDDRTGKELNYQKLRALLAAADKDDDRELADEAAKTASEILRADINYKDIRKLKEQAAALTARLKG